MRVVASQPQLRAPQESGYERTSCMRNLSFELRYRNFARSLLFVFNKFPTTSTSAATNKAVAPIKHHENVHSTCRRQVRGQKSRLFDGRHYCTSCEFWRQTHSRRPSTNRSGLHTYMYFVRRHLPSPTSLVRFYWICQLSSTTHQIYYSAGSCLLG